LAIVSPAKPRASIEETSRGLEVIIPAKRNWLATLFLGFWLCGWAAGEILVPIATFAKGAPPWPANLFAAVWLGAWTLAGGFVLYIFLASLVGRERILLSPPTLSIQRELFGMGRVREYELVHVRDLRASLQKYSLYDFRSTFLFWGIGGGNIAFDHGAATVRFGAGLEESEARTIIERMRSRAAFG